MNEYHKALRHIEIHQKVKKEMIEKYAALGQPFDASIYDRMIEYIRERMTKMDPNANEGKLILSDRDVQSKAANDRPSMAKADFLDQSTDWLMS